jgi:hypothetical protein
MIRCRARWHFRALLLSMCLGAVPSSNAQVFARVAAPGESIGQSDGQKQQTPAAPDQSDRQGSQTNKPSLIVPLKPVEEGEPYRPITSRQRLRWMITETIWPEHLAGGVITSAFGTALDRPREDGPHWGGFAERFGVRLTGVTTSNVIEAGAGALWGEDPRYFRNPGEPFGARVMSVIKQTFTARRPDGDFALAYARFAAISGSNFLSNTWRPNSEANNHDAILRTLEGFAGRMSSNSWDEFWPDVKVHVFHRSH